MRSPPVGYSHRKAPAPSQKVIEVTIKIRHGDQELDVETLQGAVTASEAKHALFEVDASWVGALRKEGSLVVLAGALQLKSGCTYILMLQRPAGKRSRLNAEECTDQPLQAKRCRCDTN